MSLYNTICQFSILLKESAVYLSLHPLKAKAAGRKVVMLPLILYADDTSGIKVKSGTSLKAGISLLACRVMRMQSLRTFIYYAALTACLHWT